MSRLLPLFSRSSTEIRNDSPTLTITYLPPTSLAPNRRNARTHTTRQIHQIADSIRSFGFLIAPNLAWVWIAWPIHDLIVEPAPAAAIANLRERHA